MHQHKTLKYLSVLLLCPVLLAGSCKKGEALTKETQTGANTFSCKINGKVFKPAATGLLAGNALFRTYDQNSKTLGVYAKNVDNKPYKRVYLTIENYRGEGLYNINLGNVYCEYREESLDIIRFLGYEGYIKITKDDQANRILAGTFEFKAEKMDNPNETVNITDGRFDIGN